MNDIARRGVIEIIPEAQFLEALQSGQKLRLKLGLDPSKPDLHIGHGVLLRKLRQLQDIGHQVVLIVGDWTAQIGDPSGQSATRPMLTADEVRANADTYMRQFFHVVDRKRTEVRWQSEWFDAFTLADVIRLASRFTVAQMLQREDFRQRFDAKQPLGIHELLYPLLQAYDSVVIEADVEFGGSDQLFNLLVGRELQQEMGQQPQIVFVMNLLVGTDGVQKMSKSLGNTIEFEDPPSEQYGKVMSVPDSALPDYLELATDLPEEELAYLKLQLKERATNPMELKKRLAREIVAQFHGEKAAQEAETEFARTFQQHELPQDVPEVVVNANAPSGQLLIDLHTILVEAGLAASKAEARRLTRQGAIEIEGRKISPDEATGLAVLAGTVIRVGKHRFLRIVAADEGETS
ncbi:MAG: tyrosine--tRNA ligase [Chloroflexi bacterium]|nr:tyrosine--tRNA ligase [Chloroflexota bacterium]